MRPFSLYLILFCLSWSSFGWAQEPNYYSFNELYGFDVNTVYDVDQGADGTFWFGTDRGLVRFDGNDFKFYTLSGFDKDASNVKIDQYDRVWFSNFGGQLCYLKDDSLHLVISESPEFDFIGDYEVVSKTEVVYTSFSGHKILKQSLRPNTAREVLFEGTPKVSILFLETVSEGFQFTTFENLVAELKSGAAIRTYHIDSASLKVQLIGEVFMPHESLNLSATNWQGKTYALAASGQNIKLFNVTDSDDGPVNISSQPISASLINGLQEFGDRLLMHTKSGTIVFDGKGGQKSILDKFSMATFFEDQEGNTWVATLNAGIHIIPSFEVEHTTFSREKIIATERDEHDQLFAIDFAGNFYRSAFPYLQVEKVGTGLQGIGKMLYNPFAKTVRFNGDRRAYQTQDQLLIELDDDQFVKDILHFSADIQLVAVSQGLYFRSTSGDSIPHQEVAYLPPASQDRFEKYSTQWWLGRSRAEQIQADATQDFIYIDFIDGLRVLSKGNPYQLLKKDGADILSERLQKGYEDGVWTFTENGKLYKFEGLDCVFDYDVDYPVNVLAEYKGYLFCANKQGVHRIDLKTKEDMLLSRADGLRSEEPVDIFIKQDTVHLLAGNSLQRFHYQYSPSNTTPPILTVGRVQLFDQEIERKQQYFFEVDQNALTFHFNVNAIRSQRNYTVHYRLVGASDQWTQTNASNLSARFYNLASGEYTLEVFAKNEDGVESAIERVEFTIDQHFTRKWWFYLLLITVSGILVLLIYRRRAATLRREQQLKTEQQELKKELYKSRITAIRSQMNPHFMFNALNTIQEFIVTNQSAIAAEYLADFADLMRMYLDQSKEDQISLRDEFAAMEIYLRLESLRFDDKLEYQIIHDGVAIDDVEIPVLLLQPFVENAVKHGLLHQSGAKSLMIKATTHHDQLIIEIRDSGIGRKASQKINQARINKHQSFASSAIEQRIQLLNQNSNMSIESTYTDLTDEQGQACGTLVTLKLKF